MEPGFRSSALHRRLLLDSLESVELVGPGSSGHEQLSDRKCRGTALLTKNVRNAVGCTLVRVTCGGSQDMWDPEVLVVDDGTMILIRCDKAGLGAPQTPSNFHAGPTWTDATSTLGDGDCKPQYLNPPLETPSETQQKNGRYSIHCQCFETYHHLQIVSKLRVRHSSEFGLNPPCCSEGIGGGLRPNSGSLTSREKGKTCSCQHPSLPTRLERTAGRS
jgi:hypothetical protein